MWWETKKMVNIVEKAKEVVVNMVNKGKSGYYGE